MLKGLLTITSESFLLLRRDKIFLSAAIAGIAFTILANIASDWSVEDFTKILFDIGAFGFQLTGSIVAIFWGTKIISDSMQQGSLEVQLAAPVSRTTWILGRLLGLSFALILLSVLLLAIWQAVMLLNQFGVMSLDQLYIFAFMTLGWLILASMAIFFSSFCSAAIAMFASICVWITGLSSSIVAHTISPDASPLTKGIVSVLSRAWDLQQLNLVSSISGESLVADELLWKAGYGFVLFAVFATLSVIIFSRKDIA